MKSRERVVLLLRSATLLPTGELASNGYEALAVYDTPELGGNGDGFIDERDLIWPYLRIWIDDNFDGVSQKQEIHSLRDVKIVGIYLKYVRSRRVDGDMNVHDFVGIYLRRVEGRNGYFEIRPERIEDIFFVSAPISGH